MTNMTVLSTDDIGLFQIHRKISNIVTGDIGILKSTGDIGDPPSRAPCTMSDIRDWSPITGRGGGYKTVGGDTRSFTPTKRGGGAEKVLAMLKGGGGTTSFGVVFTR